MTAAELQGLPPGLSQAVLTAARWGMRMWATTWEALPEDRAEPLLNVKMKGRFWDVRTWAVLPARLSLIWNPNICRTVWKSCRMIWGL